MCRMNSVKTPAYTARRAAVSSSHITYKDDHHGAQDNFYAIYHHPEFQRLYAAAHRRGAHHTPNAPVFQRRLIQRAMKRNTTKTLQQYKSPARHAAAANKRAIRPSKTGGAARFAFQRIVGNMRRADIHGFQ